MTFVADCLHSILPQADYTTSDNLTFSTPTIRAKDTAMKLSLKICRMENYV